MGYEEEEEDGEDEEEGEDDARVTMVVSREDAVLLQEELTEMVAPLHNDLLLLCLPEL